MTAYFEDFAEAHEFTNFQIGTDLNPDFPISPSYKTNTTALTPSVAEVLHHTFRAPHKMDDHCYLAVLMTSARLSYRRIPHAITIGDVEYADGARYTNATPESLLADIEAGMNVIWDDAGKLHLPPASAHAWITMPSGEILDLTIRAHMDKLRGQQTIPDGDFESALFWSSLPDSRVARHIPMMTGLGYQLRVATGIDLKIPFKEENYEAYMAWRDLYLDLMRASYP